MESTLKTRIIELLRQYPALRDTPDKVIYSIWMTEISVETKYQSLHQFFTAVYQNKLKMTSPTTIDRMRRQIQAKMPELRGKLYKERLGKAERVRKDIFHEDYNQIK
jgi:hypothetical protein